MVANDAVVIVVGGRKHSDPIRRRNEQKSNEAFCRYVRTEHVVLISGLLIAVVMVSAIFVF
jgi:hypothetical protein